MSELLAGSECFVKDDEKVYSNMCNVSNVRIGVFYVTRVNLRTMFQTDIFSAISCKKRLDMLKINYRNIRR